MIAIHIVSTTSTITVMLSFEGLSVMSLGIEGSGARAHGLRGQKLLKVGLGGLDVELSESLSNTKLRM